MKIEDHVDLSKSVDIQTVGRLTFFKVGPEFGLVNGSPSTEMLEVDGGGVAVDGGRLIHFRTTTGWRDYQPSLRAIIPSGVQGVPWWGPPDDGPLTEGTGSGRVHAGFCPAGIMQTHTDESFDAGLKWVRKQGLRGCHYSQWYTPSPYEPYHLGGGYQTAVDSKGGFHPLYSLETPEFEGVAYGPSGWPVPNARHASIDSLVWFSLTFNSYSAMLSACGQWDAMASALYVGERWSSRAYGHFFNACGYLYELAWTHENYQTGLCPRGTDEILDAMRVALRRLSEQNFMGAPCPDNGETAEGGHLTGVVSESSFFVGILLSGLLTMRRIIEGLHGDLEGPGNGDLALVDWQIEQCLGFLTSCRLVQHLTAGDAEALFVEDLEAGGWRCLEGKINGTLGVQSRFVLAALVKARLWMSIGDVQKWIDGMTSLCDERKTWGGKNDRAHWMAECGLAS